MAKQLDVKPEGGIQFKIEDRKKDTYPNYSGQIMTPDGKRYDIATWIRESASGNKFLTHSVKEPYNQPETQSNTTNQSGDSDLPF